ncbi:MAG: metal ion transporter periplasmic protein surface adhesin [Proteobacteria bacterium]|nr:metal ion transporter periplasmic protein surface adhesin [Pseudomonadota bacterium]
MRLIRTACCIALTLPLFAHSAPAHVHGVAKMDLAVDGNKLTLSMEMPLDNLVGFEHLPKTDKQKAALAEAMASLKNAADLFVPTVAAGCKVDTVDVGDPFPGGKAKADGHADVDADYVFRCAQPAALKGLETKLFKRFGRLHRVDVQRATAAGQGAATLTPEQPGMNW